MNLGVVVSYGDDPCWCDECGWCWCDEYWLNDDDYDNTFSSLIPMFDIRKRIVRLSIFQ